jgi:selenocysteine lyase/cysteine desulfurase
MSGEKIENYQNLLKWSERAKSNLAILLGANSSRIAWIDNVSNALNILANGIHWKKGDEIILNDIEFPSNVYPFLNLQKQGIEVKFAKSSNGKVDLEEIEKLVTPSTKLISISHVQFLTGYRANLEILGNYCRERGIIFCVDAIQSAGVVNIDVEKFKIDYLAGGTQKWLISSQGLSYLYITEELHSKIEQKNVGWTSVNNAWNLLDYDLSLKSGADSFQNGTQNSLGIAIFDAVLELFISAGIQFIESRILENTNLFESLLAKMGIETYSSKFEQLQKSGIVSFYHEKADEIFNGVEQRNVKCALREKVIRFSPHFYNNGEEIKNTVEILNECLRK